MFSNKKYEEKNFDNYLRIFPKVSAIKGLSFLKVHIMCDVLSFKIKGKSYYKSSKAFAKEYGLAPKTIKDAFQELEHEGYINTQPYNDGSHDQSLREVEVFDMDRYIYSDDHLTKIGFEPKPIVKKDKDADSEWPAVKAKKKKKAESNPLNKAGGETISQSEKKNITPELNNIKAIETPALEVPVIKNETAPTLEAINIKPIQSDFDVKQYLTSRKLAFAKKFDGYKSGDDIFTIEKVYSLSKEALDKFFYYDENIWKMKTREDDGQDLWENIHGINLKHDGGSRLTLFMLDKKEKPTASYQLDMKDFNGYLDKRGIGFGDLTEDNFITLEQRKKQPLETV
ncbi:MAG TPA: hypothetical protein VK783_16430 [Bacteroidia bacterium]|jgi:hypothetical protein|nr:hypothetical protein [Bacteroidia bacterium]